MITLNQPKAPRYYRIYPCLVMSYGITIATVFGCMENFARYTGGLCSASQSTIAKETGVKRQTVNKAIKELKEIGLITDTTIDKGQHPHWYDVPEFDEERWRFTSRDQPDDFEMKKQ